MRQKNIRSHGRNLRETRRKKNRREEKKRKKGKRRKEKRGREEEEKYDLERGGRRYRSGEKRIVWKLMKSTPTSSVGGWI